MSRVTTFADIFQAKQYVGLTTSNTFAQLNSVLTVTGGTGNATFANIISTISSAGYSVFDPSTMQYISTVIYDFANISTGLSTVNANQDLALANLSTGLSTVTGNQTINIANLSVDLYYLSTGLSSVNGFQFEQIEALYEVISTSFSTINGEFTQLSSSSSLVTMGEFSTVTGELAFDVYQLSTGLSTINGNQYEQIDALYEVISTSFSTINGEFTQLSSASTLITRDEFSTLTSIVEPRLGKQPVCTAGISSLTGVSGDLVLFTSTIANGWNWFSGSGPIASTMYCSTSGIYEVTANVNYTTANTNGGLILQLRNGGGSPLDEVLGQLPATGSVYGSNSIRLTSMQPIAAGATLQFYMSTTQATHTIDTLPYSYVSAKLVWDSNVPAL